MSTDTKNGAPSRKVTPKSKQSKDKKSVSDYVAKWKDKFIESNRIVSKSRKTHYTYWDAVKFSKRNRSRSNLDKVMIKYLKFISSNPLKDNDFYKYVNSYQQGKKLDPLYFRHDLERLQYYYDRVNEDKNYRPFNIKNFKRYVLFMMLKFSGVYDTEIHDDLFNVKKDGVKYVLNGRTKQQMPHNYQFYEDFKANETRLNIECAAKQIQIHFLKLTQPI